MGAGTGSLRTAVIWNLGSVGVQAAAGAALNFFVGRAFGEAGLGVFSQVLALQIVYSQLGAFGLHYAASRYASLHRGRAPRLNEIYWATFAAAGAGGAATALLGWLSLPLLRVLFKSESLLAAWQLALPGLFCFCVNKVLLQFLNGVGRHRIFATFSAFRFVLWFVVSWALAGLAGQDVVGVVGGGIAATESALLLGLVAITLVRSFPSVRNWRAWNRRVVRFGSRSFLSGALLELNTRIDVFFLGIFAGDRAVGVFALAGLFIDGAYQIIVALRNSVQSELSHWLRRDDFWEKLRGVRRTSRLLVGAAVVGVVVTLPFLSQHLLGKQAFSGSVTAFGIMGVGLFLAAPDLVLGMALVQGGRPALQTLSLGYQILCAVTFNVALVPTFGVTGAAVATALAFVVGSRINRRLVLRMAREELALPHRVAASV